MKPQASRKRNSTRHGRFPDLRISASIAFVELLQRLRSRSNALWILFITLALAGASIAFFDLGQQLGGSLEAGDGGWQSYVGSVFLLALAGFTAYHLLNGIGLAPTNVSALLTIRPPKDIVAGQLLFRFCETVFIALIPTVAFFLGLSVAIGSPLPLVGGVAGALVLNAVATIAGYSLGLLLKGIYKRYSISWKVAVIAGVPLLLGYAVFLYSDGIAIAVERLQPIVVNSPLEWIADLALLTTPASVARADRAAIVLLGTALFLTVALLSAGRIAAYTWYADDTSADTDRTHTDERSRPEPLLGRMLRVVSPSAGTRGVAAASMRRTYRSAYVLVLVAGLLVLAGVPIAERIVTTGRIPWYTPWIALFYGVSLAGSFHSLNVLGVQGKTLPLVLTARVDGQQVVTGHVVAGVVSLAPITTLLAVVLGIAARWDAVELVLLGVLTPFAVCLGAMVATGIGVRLPRYRSSSIHRSSGMVRPAKAATVAYSLWCTVAVSLLFVLVDRNVRFALAEITGFPESGFVLTALVGLIVLGFGAVLSYRFAVARVSGYRLD